MRLSLFPNIKPVIGVIHVGALPGTPASRHTVAELVEAAASEAEVYRAGDVDGLMIENMHDTPYTRGRAGPEIVAALAVVGREVKRRGGLPTGVQVLAGANLEAMAVAHAAGLDYIRAEGFVFAHVADEGIIQSSAADLLRYRRMIGAERVEVWTDVKKKHASHAITADVSLGETATTVEFMRGDAVIVTSSVTGKPPSVEDVHEAKAHTRLPVLLGSGISASNIADFYDSADGFIVGSSLKADGYWENTIELSRVEHLMETVRKLRGERNAAGGG
ncbi:MAG TPA: BtpA/SgcQ family protein [Pyrinomonadaceae bacterium]|nr:BtpA/SgcQ family protein [Pyrinomonadaceae bacterium]